MQELAIELKNIEVIIGHRNLLSISHLAIYQWERVGIVGQNGQGKTLLLRLLAGELVPTSGTSNRYIELTMLEQVTAGQEEGATNYELLSRFAVPLVETSQLSGGEESRLKLVAALSDYHEGLLLDEPTTHLDQAGITLLSDELASYYGTLITVSHDRYFLDQTVTKILEVADGKVTEYVGNYTAYLAQKEQAERAQATAYRNYRQEERRLTEAIETTVKKADKLGKVGRKQKARNLKPDRLAGSKEKGSAVKGVQKVAKNLAKKIEQLEVVTPVNQAKKIQFQPITQRGLHNKFPIMAEQLTLKKGDKTILKNADFQFGLGKTIALQGANGCGKTSLLTHIRQRGAGLVISPNVVFASFAQLSYRLTSNLSLLTYLNQRVISSETLVRSVLHNLGFSQLTLNQPVSQLSGGELTRLILAEVFLQEANVLILDEPTNFIDVRTINALEDVIKGYPGTIILTSHDRYFIENVADERWTFEQQKLILLG